MSSLDPLEEKSLGEGKWGYSNLIYVSLILHPWKERLLWRSTESAHSGYSTNAPSDFLKRYLERQIEMLHTVSADI